MNQVSRNLLLWVAIGLAMVMLFNMFQQPQSTATRISYSDFMSRVDAGQILSVTIQGNVLTGRGAEKGSEVQAYAPDDANLVSQLMGKKVEVQAEPPEEPSWYMSLLLNWLPLLLLIGVWIFVIRQMQGGGPGKAMSFGRSRARMLNE